MNGVFLMGAGRSPCSSYSRGKERPLDSHVLDQRVSDVLAHRARHVAVLDQDTERPGPQELARHLAIHGTGLTMCLSILVVSVVEKFFRRGMAHGRHHLLFHRARVPRQKALPGGARGAPAPDASLLNLPVRPTAGATSRSRATTRSPSARQRFSVSASTRSSPSRATFPASIATTSSSRSAHRFGAFQGRRRDRGIEDLARRRPTWRNTSRSPGGSDSRAGKPVRHRNRGGRKQVVALSEQIREDSRARSSTWPVWSSKATASITGFFTTRRLAIQRRLAVFGIAGRRDADPVRESRPGLRRCPDRRGPLPRALFRNPFAFFRTLRGSPVNLWAWSARIRNIGRQTDARPSVGRGRLLLLLAGMALGGYARSTLWTVFPVTAGYLA